MTMAARSDTRRLIHEDAPRPAATLRIRLAGRRPDGGRLRPGDWGQGRNPILVYFFAVLLSAWYGGLGPGLLTTALIVVLTSHTTIPSWRVVRLTLGIASGAWISALIDLLISDIELPDGTGLDLIRHLRGGGPPPVAMSGYGSEGDIRASLEAGFAEHLTKPVDLSRLLAAIHRVTASVEAEGSVHESSL